MATPPSPPFVPGQRSPSDRRSLVQRRYAQHVNRSLASLATLIGSPVELRSSGATVTCDDGDYLDCGGFGVFLLGHCHPAVVRAVRRQLESHPLATRLFLNEQLAEAAAALSAVAPAGLDRVFFTNSGAEATELGLKLARLAGRTRVVAMEGGFHGKTLGAVSVTGRPAYRDPFAPLLPGVEFVPFGDVVALEAALAGQGPQTAVVLEPVQAEGGVRLPPPGYLSHVRRLCDESGAVLVLDEIQTGLGRLGAWWGADLAGVVPDVLLSGKILGGGVMPVGAVLATPALFAPLDADPLLHSSTFAGSPLATAAVTATLDVLRDDGLVERAAELGPQVLDLVREAVDRHCPHLVVDVRGQGLLVGIELVSGEASTELMMALLEQRVIPSWSLNASHVLRLTPPAVLTAPDLDRLGRALRAAAAQVGRALRPTAPPLPTARPTDEENPCTVHLAMSVPGREPDAVYETLSDLARYPELTETVRSVVVTEVDDLVATSAWEVAFRSGVLRWHEEDVFDPAERTITFRQLDGDLAVFDGCWRCTAEPHGTRLTFDARLDLGIPSLADALEPIAARALVENTSLIVRGLFGTAVLHETTSAA